jgi:hypothetical protein
VANAAQDADERHSKRRSKPRWQRRRGQRRGTVPEGDSAKRHPRQQQRPSPKAARRPLPKVTAATVAEGHGADRLPKVMVAGVAEGPGGDRLPKVMVAGVAEGPGGDRLPKVMAAGVAEGPGGDHVPKVMAAILAEGPRRRPLPKVTVPTVAEVRNDDRCRRQRSQTPAQGNGVQSESERPRGSGGRSPAGRAWGRTPENKTTDPGERYPRAWVGQSVVGDTGIEPVTFPV